MARFEADRTDLGILYLLQDNACGTAESISQHLDIAPSTVSERIRRLEDENVVEAYVPVINYEKLGFDHRYAVAGTGPQPFDGEAEFIDDLLEVQGIVSVLEFTTHEENFLVEIVGRTQAEVFEDFAELTDRGMTISDIDILRHRRQTPFDKFGKQYTNL